MFSNFLPRMIMGLVTMTILLCVRVYFAYYVFNQVRTMHTDTANRLSRVQTTDYVRPPAFPDHSSWVIFNSTDPATGTILHHAKLASLSSGAADGQIIPESSMELVSAKTSGNHVFLALPGRVPCATLTTLDARFDAKPPIHVHVKPGNAAQCVVEVAEADGFIQSLQDADALFVQLPGVADITFAVGGLTWN